ncbi:MAG: hypothetical protein ACR2OG_00945 [Gemmatimonadaceae bacterium]
MTSPTERCEHLEKAAGQHMVPGWTSGAYPAQVQPHESAEMTPEKKRQQARWDKLKSTINRLPLMFMLWGLLFSSIAWARYYFLWQVVLSATRPQSSCAPCPGVSRSQLKLRWWTSENRLTPQRQSMG